MSEIVPPAVSVGYLLSQIGAHSMSCFEERLQALGITPHHAGLLRMLERNGGITQQGLADLFGIFPSRLVALLDELEQKKLVVRSSDAADRRRRRLHLTTTGQRCLEQIGSVELALDDSLLGSLSKADRDALEGFLQAIVAHQTITPAVHPSYRSLDLRRKNGTKPSRAQR